MLCYYVYVNYGIRFCLRRNVEDDLETMWQVASEDNRKLQETLRKTTRQLQQHEGLRHLRDAGFNDDLLLTCSDDDDGGGELLPGAT